MKLDETVRSNSVVIYLSMLSGACGLAYEILFVRLFSNYFGDSFVIAGVTICTVFMGIAFGAWNSSKYAKRLGLIEGAIGVYSICIATVFSVWGFQIVSLSASIWLNAVLLAVVLGFPAFLIGTCIPLFAAYARPSEEQASSGFAKVYGLYNVGAFLSVLAIEFWLFRTFGIQATCYIIGCCNLFISAVLLVGSFQDRKSPITGSAPRLLPKVAKVLFLLSFASGVFQLFVLRLSYSVFGPLHENFAIVLASALIGVSVGAWFARKEWVTLSQVSLLLVLSVLAMMIMFPAALEIWSSASAYDLGDIGEVILKGVLLGGLPLLVFVLFGTLVPLAVNQHGAQATEVSGRLLAVSSLGNGLGALAMFLILFKTLELPVIGLSIAFLCLVAGLWFLPDRLKPFQIATGGLLAISLVLATLQTWPTVELLLGYRSLFHKDQVAYRTRNYKDAIVYRSFDQNAAIVGFHDQTRSLMLNGYQSLTFGPLKKSELHEVIVGATPVLFSKDTDNALVFGLGSGITGGSTARFYERTKIVEINPAILNVPQHFERENHNVMKRSNVTVALEDGISSLLTSEKSYDAIVNTVTSPQYYSAAKLYTQDFYEIVKTRLNEGGSYSSWFDVNIDKQGISIMLNTLESSFEHCRYFLLSAGYFNVVCSQDPLVYRSSRIVADRIKHSLVEPLFFQFGLEGGFQDSLSALEVSFDARFFERSSDDINTLDRPAIEFVVARERDAGAAVEMLGDTVARNIDFQRKSGFGNRDWRQNCKIISRMSGLEFGGCD